MKAGGGRRGGEKQMVPKADFSSYYGRPVLKETVWGPDIPSYLFLGGLAGASSGLATGRKSSVIRRWPARRRPGRPGAISLSMVALVHDLGRPARFINTLWVLKVTSPMSVGTWLLSAYTPLALAAVGCAVTGRLPRGGAAATVGAAALGTGVATYTSVLLADTAVPAWHDAHRELPYVFAGSALPLRAASGCWPSARTTPGRPSGSPCWAPRLSSPPKACCCAAWARPPSPTRRAGRAR